MKSVCIAILFSLLLSVGGVTASQMDLSDPTGLPQALYLSELGVIKAPDSSLQYTDEHIEFFRLRESITRQEVMKIVAKLSDEEISNSCRGIFSDVDTMGWGCKYIEWAFSQNIIASNNTFRPNDNITKTEAMKLILRVKGISKVQNTSLWQEDYMLTAYEYGIIDEKYYDFNDDASRGWIFKIATSTIQKEESIKQIQKEKVISDEAM